MSTAFRWSLWLAAVWIAAGLMLALTMTSHAEDVQREYVRLTFYVPTGSPMRDGAWPYVGAAACGSYFPMGSVLEFPDGFTVVCEDTGYLARGQVDVFAPSMAWGRTNIEAAYGTYTWLNVRRWGW